MDGSGMRLAPKGGFRSRLLLSFFATSLAGVLASPAEAQTPGLVLPPSQVQVDEGGSASYTVALATQPTDTVTVSITGRATGAERAGVTWNPASLRFTTSDWNTAQRVTVTAAEDDHLDTNWEHYLTHTASGGDYSGVALTRTQWIIDNDAPNQGTVTLTPVAQEVTEGEPLQFFAHLDPPTVAEWNHPGAPSIKFTSRVGDFVRTTLPGASRTPNPGISPVMLWAPTIDDGVQEPDGSITASIIGFEWHGYRAGTPSSATIAIRDDDDGVVETRPTVSLTRDPDVTEGQSATFTVTVTPPPTTALAVQLYVHRHLDYVAAGDLGVQSVTVGTSGSASYSVATVNDEVQAPIWGRVYVSVLVGQGYRVVAPYRQTVLVYDDDGPEPKVSIGGVPAKINARSPLTATFNWSEDVTGFATGDVTVTGGTRGAFSGSGRSYTLVVTPTDGSNVVVTVAANSATVGTHRGPPTPVSATATWDAAAPTVSIAGVPPKINARSPLTATFNWSEDVTGFAAGDVTVTGGAKGAFTAVNGSSYTLAVTPTGSANVVVTVAANSATDGLNAGPASAASATATWDTAAPTVGIGGVPAKINSRAALSVGFTFTEDVTGFATGDVTVTGGTKGTFSGSGRSYTLAVTPAGGSNVVVTVAANSATDGVNAGPASAISATATWDAAAPTVGIGGVPAKINSRAALGVGFTFSEDVMGFATGDVTVTGGTKGAFAGSGRSYTLAVTPAGGSNVAVTVAADSVTDGLNPGPASAASATATWDAVAPTVSIAGVPPKINSRTALTATFSWSEDVTGFAAGDVTVTGGTKGAFAGSGRSYTLVVTPAGGSNVAVTVAANSVTDGLNAGPASAVSATATWDATDPTVSIAGVPPKINARSPLTATFNWSEDVTGFAAGDVTVTGGAKGAFTAVNGSSYTLAVTPTGSANVKVEVAAGAATDGVNTGPASAVSATATWDAAAPTVSIAGVPPKINSRTALTATFNWSEDVTGFAAGDVTVTGGTKGAFAGSGRSYTLAVTPAGGSNVAVTVAADSVTDGLNPGPASAASATATWDAVAPTVSIAGVPPKINSRTALTATFSWSEDVTGFAAGDVTVTGGTKGAFAGSGRSYTLVVTPAGGSNVAVTVAANSVTDGLNAGPASAVSATATWDATDPTVSIAGVPPKINARSPLTATFNWSEDVTGFAAGDVTVTGGAKGAFTAVNGSSYTLAVTPTGSANVKVEVAAGAATDGVNTGPASAVSATATWDAAAPTVSLTGVPPKINSTAALSVTFAWSEDVTEFVTADVTVTGGTKGAFSGSGRSYTLAVTPTDGSNVAVTVAAAAATDGVNTGPASAVSATATWDAVGPDGLHRRGAAEDQLENRAHGDVQLVRGRDRVRRGRRDGDRRHQGRVRGQRQVVHPGGDAGRRVQRGGHRGGGLGDRRPQPGSGVGGLRDGDVGRGRPRRSPSPGCRRRSTRGPRSRRRSAGPRT